MLGTMSGNIDTVFSEKGDSEKYVVYNLTPNMWEEPWVRHLLAELPMSRYDVRDLWSPPTARPRLRRLSIFLESLLPAPLRPTRRMLRRVVNPHDYSVFVYNTWCLDSGVRIELSRLLARFKHVGIVSVDEPTRDSKETYKNVTFALRIGFNAERYRGAQNLMVAPLGVPKSLHPPSVCESHHGSYVFMVLSRRDQEHQQKEHGRSIAGRERRQLLTANQYMEL
jgi:hypothetical protein